MSSGVGRGCTGCRSTPFPEISSHVLSAAWKLHLWFSMRLFTTMKRHLQALDAFFWALNASKMHLQTWLYPNLIGEPTALSQTTYLMGDNGEDGSLPSPQEPLPTLGLQPRIPALRASEVHPKTSSWLRHWQRQSVHWRAQMHIHFFTVFTVIIFILIIVIITFRFSHLLLTVSDQ